jgi:hypothetical protein
MGTATLLGPMMSVLVGQCATMFSAPYDCTGGPTAADTVTPQWHTGNDMSHAAVLPLASKQQTICGSNSAHTQCVHGNSTSALARLTQPFRMWHT